MKFWECQKKVNLSANYVQIKKELRNNYRNSLFFKLLLLGSNQGPSD